MARARRYHKANWDGDRLDQLRADWDAGAPIKAMAVKFGCHPDTITKRAMELRLSPRPGLPSWAGGSNRGNGATPFSAHEKAMDNANTRATTLLIERIVAGIERGSLRSPPCAKSGAKIIELPRRPIADATTADGRSLVGCSAAML